MLLLFDNYKYIYFCLKDIVDEPIFHNLFSIHCCISEKTWYLVLLISKKSWWQAPGNIFNVLSVTCDLLQSRHVFYICIANTVYHTPVQQFRSYRIAQLVIITMYYEKGGSKDRYKYEIFLV